MKRLLVLLMVCGLLCVGSASAFGAIHNSWGDFAQVGTYGWELPSWGGWYYTDKEDSYFIAGTQMIKDVNLFGGIYYKNDQTFAEYFHQGDNTSAFDQDSSSYFKGSYEFTNGIFLGLLHQINTSQEQYKSKDFINNLFSLGYVYNFGNGGYVALSDDLYSIDKTVENKWYQCNHTDRGTAGYDLDFRYYPDKMRIYGQIYDAMSDVDVVGMYYDKGISYQFGLSYQFAKPFVAGIDLSGAPDHVNSWAVGGTYTLAFGELNARYTQHKDDGDNTQSISQFLGMFNLTNQLKAGPVYTNDDATGYYGVESIYQLKNNQDVRAAYQFGNEKRDIPEALTLAYHIKF